MIDAYSKSSQKAALDMDSLRYSANKLTVLWFGKLTVP